MIFALISSDHSFGQRHLGTQCTLVLLASMLSTLINYDYPIEPSGTCFGRYLCPHYCLRLISFVLLLLLLHKPRIQDFPEDIIQASLIQRE